MAAPIFADHPQPGYYWMRRHRNGPRLPVAIWSKDGALVARVGEAMDDPHAIWTYCAANKVDKEAAKFAFTHGRWPDDPEPTAALTNATGDEFLDLRAEIEDKLAQADDYLVKHPEVKSQQTCDLLRNVQAQLLALNKRADALHELEKRPVLEKGREIDDKFRFRAAIKVMTTRLRQRFEAFMRAEEARLKREAEEKFRAEQERIAAERAKLLVDDPIAAATGSLPELPLAPEVPKVQAGGGFGRAAGLRTEWVATVEDYEKAALYFIGHPDLRAVVDRLAKHAVKDAKGSINIPGVKVTQERRAA